MVLFAKHRNISICFSRAVLLLSLFLLAGCGGSAGAQASSPTQTAPATVSSITPAVPAATATSQALLQEITLVGQPTARMLKGTTFEVTGQLKNGDSKQHDITLQAVLLDGSGKVIATATTFLDNIKGGQVAAFTIEGSTPQPTWSGVQVTVTRVSENIDGTGGD